MFKCSVIALFGKEFIFVTNLMELQWFGFDLKSLRHSYGSYGSLRHLMGCLSVLLLHGLGVN